MTASGGVARRIVTFVFAPPNETLAELGQGSFLRQDTDSPGRRYIPDCWG
jgi:hypothetical protein